MKKNLMTSDPGLVQPRKTGNRPDMSEKELNGK